MNPVIYLVYLVEVGRNSAEFAVGTIFVGFRDEVEIRKPSCDFDGKIVDKAIYVLDRAAPQINTWSQLFTWFARGSGWAAFTSESAQELVPHWFSKSTEFKCQRQEVSGISYFIDSTKADLDPQKFLDSEIFGDVDPNVDPEARRWFRNLMGNLVLTRQPIFIKS